MRPSASLKLIYIWSAVKPGPTEHRLLGMTLTKPRREPPQLRISTAEHFARQSTALGPDESEFELSEVSDGQMRNMESEVTTSPSQEFLDSVGISLSNYNLHPRRFARLRRS